LSELQAGIADTNENLPALCKMQMDLLVNLHNDMAGWRRYSLQSVGQAG
jgi:hypothetical protein